MTSAYCTGALRPHKVPVQLLAKKRRGVGGVKAGGVYQNEQISNASRTDWRRNILL